MMPLSRIRTSIALATLLVGTVFLSGALSASWQAFLTQCPNTDVLSWDANLRFRTVVDLYEEIREGQYWLPVYYALWSPTWPALRSFLALGLFFGNPSGPGTVLDVSISFAFYVLLFVSLFFIAWDLSRDFLRGSLVWIFASILILYSRQLTLYGLSSMLETQGMFFMLWSIYFLYKIYEQERLRRYFLQSGAPERLPYKRRWFYGLLIFGQGLFHTKYPYGLMLFIAILLYEFFREPLRFFSFFRLSLRYHYKGPRRLILWGAGFVTFLFVVFVFLSKMDATWAPKEALRSKTVRNLIWIVSLSFFIDFNLYVYRFRKELAEFFDSSFRSMYLAYLAPVAFWLLLHPDRLGSILGTQQHTQEASRSFFDSLFFDVFDRSEPLYLALVLASLGLGLYILMIIRELPARRGLATALRHPLVSVFALLVIQFLTLEKLTGNKQLRHIYHLVPALLLVCGVIAVRLPHLLGLSRGRLSRMQFVLSRISYLLLPLSLLVFWMPASDASSLKASRAFSLETLRKSISGASYVRGRWLCFTDYNKDLFTPVRKLVEQIPKNKNYIFFNSLHELPGMDLRRVYATDFDVLLRERLLKTSHKTRNFNSFPPFSWRDYDAVLLLKPDCSKKPDLYSQKVLSEIARHGERVVKQERFTEAGSQMCLEVLYLHRR